MQQGERSWMAVRGMRSSYRKNVPLFCSNGVQPCTHWVMRSPPPPRSDRLPPAVKERSSLQSGVKSWSTAGSIMSKIMECRNQDKKWIAFLDKPVWYNEEPKVWASVNCTLSLVVIVNTVAMSGNNVHAIITSGCDIWYIRRVYKTNNLISYLLV